MAIDCAYCQGEGWTAEHDPNDTSWEHMQDGVCTNCPVQMPCDACEGTGIIREEQDNETNMSDDTGDFNIIEALAEVNNQLSSLTIHTTTSTRGASRGVAWTEEIDPRRDNTKWVQKDGEVKSLSELETSHIKNILAGFNMGENWGRQQNKKEALLAEYNKRKNDK